MRLTKAYPNGTTTIDAVPFGINQEAIDTTIRNSEPIKVAVERLKDFEDKERDTKMKKRYIIEGIAAVVTAIAIALITTLIITSCDNAAYAAEEFETWYVGCEGLNLRTEAATDSDVITIMPHGTELTIIGTDGGDWWQAYDGERTGWVHKAYMVDTPDKYAGGEYGEYIGVFWVTGYTPNPAENAGYTTTCLGDDLWSNVGNVVAVDKSVIPLNRTIYIEGIGYRRTRDTGVRGRVIDVLTSSDAESDAITANRKVWVVE